jgi:hypothetical protein
MKAKKNMDKNHPMFKTHKANDVINFHFHVLVTLHIFHLIYFLDFNIVFFLFHCYNFFKGYFPLLFSSFFTFTANKSIIFNKIDFHKKRKPLINYFHG